MSVTAPIASTAMLWCPYRRPAANGRLRVFCFPHAGGSASFYRDWSARVPDGVDVCAVQPPGREQRLAETPYDNLDRLIPALAEALSPLFDVPFVFFGHSMGALMAFELARELRRTSRRRPISLLLSGRRAPHLSPLRQPIHGLPDREFILAISELGGASVDLLSDPNIVDLCLPVLRADITMTEQYGYRDEAPLDVPIHLYGGRADPNAPEEDLRSWARHSRRPIHLTVFPGNHFFLVQHAAAFLAALSNDLSGLMCGRQWT